MLTRSITVEFTILHVLYDVKEVIVATTHQGRSFARSPLRGWVEIASVMIHGRCVPKIQISTCGTHARAMWRSLCETRPRSFEAS